MFRVLGDEHRLAMVDALRLSDRTPTELQELTGLASNLLAFHLDALEEVGLIERHRSQGDGRRRYVSLRHDTLAGVLEVSRLRAGMVLFVCTRNSARSQVASALWEARTGGRSMSAGTDPAPAVHPLAVEVAADHGLDLSGARPRSYQEVEADPQLVVSVCDRARESGLAFDVPLLHWSIADPADGDRDTFQTAFDEIARRVDVLAGQVAA
ncbi:MAG: helix-turn-helix domain-containing protein [Actinobacteria bacterium]|nr:helix-turn-helix domain-containing protein [Actinomycetota bacterium]